jgi:hypothetical protein
MPFASGLIRDDSLTIDADGAQLKLDLRLPWMRSLPWASIRAIAIEVGDRPIDPDSIAWTYGEHSGELDDIAAASDYWVIGAPLSARFAALDQTAPDGPIEVVARVDLAVPYIPGPHGGPLPLPIVQRRGIATRSTAD